MRLFVTGGAGFIGSCFVHQAMARGDEVIVYDALTYAGHKENLAEFMETSEQDEHENFAFVQGDISNGGLVSRMLNEYQPDAIIHVAAESHVDNSIEAPAEFIHTNIVGSYTLLEAARQYYDSLQAKKRDQFRFIHISTDEVYGELGDDGAFTEDSAYQPNSPYSASKAASDHLARAWFTTYGLPTIITNCSNNYGPRQFPEKLIPKMITNALAGTSLPVYGRGEQVRDWIHVEDHCRGLYLALTNGIPGETYVFGGHAEKQNIEVVKTLCSALDSISPRADGNSYAELITFVDDRAGHDWRYAIDDSKAQERLGFTREHSFELGIQATIQWYLEHEDWCVAVTNSTS